MTAVHPAARTGSSCLPTPLHTRSRHHRVRPVTAACQSSHRCVRGPRPQSRGSLPGTGPTVVLSSRLMPYPVRHRRPDRSPLSSSTLPHCCPDWFPLSSSFLSGCRPNWFPLSSSALRRCRPDRLPLSSSSRGGCYPDRFLLSPRSVSRSRPDQFDRRRATPVRSIVHPLNNR